MQKTRVRKHLRTIKRRGPDKRVRVHQHMRRVRAKVNFYLEPKSEQPVSFKSTGRAGMIRDIKSPELDLAEQWATATSQAETARNLGEKGLANKLDTEARRIGVRMGFISTSKGLQKIVKQTDERSSMVEGLRRKEMAQEEQKERLKSLMRSQKIGRY